MSWSTPADLRAQAQRWWDRGDLLRECVSPSLDWPLRLALRSPTSAELAECFEATREWVGAIAAMPHVAIEWRDWTHRVQGRQRLPAAAFVATLDDALSLVAQTQAASRFRALWQRTAEGCPALLPWLAKHPLRCLAFADRWSRLLAVVAWLRVHPRPGIYLRQIDVAGVDSKFIESHRGVLAELLDLALPPEAIDPRAKAGAAQFARRYGFLDKPVRIRFRLLDPALPGLPGCGPLADITLDAVSFATLDLPVARAFVTENEVNFLAFPRVAGAVVIFGAGYGWDALARADWLHRCEMHYWGDIDTHGFVILDQLRECFPHVASFLMDVETLLAHREHWGEEPDLADRSLPRLTRDEAALYDDLRLDRIRARLRLEQERVGFGHVLRHLGRIGSETTRVLR